MPSSNPADAPLKMHTDAFVEADALYFSCYGAQVGILADAVGVLPALLDRLPPHATISDAPVSSCTYQLRLTEATPDSPHCTLSLGNTTLVDNVPLTEGLNRLVSSLQVAVSCHAQNYLFVHAGAVVWKGTALLLPGLSHAGKTTLVKALVEAGATYYSDEFAVLDDNGRVHPYARPLAVRDEAGQVTHQPVETLGGVAGTKPVPVGWMLALQYERGAVWEPTPLSAGQGALRLLENTVMARTRSEDALRIFGRVMETAQAWQGKRGEATQTVAALLHLLEAGG